MNLVVDTSVWSLVLRRQRVDAENPFVQAFHAHVNAGHGLFLAGPVLQELLDGVRSEPQFSRLLAALDAFPLVPLTRQTFVLAARMRTDCRRKGVQAGNVDFLVAAACVEAGFPLLTADEDFARIARCTDLILAPVQAD